MSRSEYIKQIEFFHRHQTSSVYEIFLPNIANIDKYATLVTFAIGVIGNILSAIVWWYPKMRIKESTVLTLMFLSVNDIFCLMLTLIKDAERVWSVEIFFYKSICQFYNVILNSSKLLSLMLLMTACIQHRTSLKEYHNFQYYKTKRWIYLILLLELIASILFYIGDGYYSDLNISNSFFRQCQVVSGAWSSQGYKIYYWLVQFILLTICIVVISSICVVILHKGNFYENRPYFLHKYNCNSKTKKRCDCFIQENEYNLKLTKAILFCGYYTVFTTIPKLIIICLVPLNTPGDVRMTDFEVKADSAWERYFNIESARSLFDELQLTQYSVRFIIYLTTNQQFRANLAGIFGLSKGDGTTTSTSAGVHYGPIRSRSSSAERLESELDSRHHGHRHRPKSSSRTRSAVTEAYSSLPRPSQLQPSVRAMVAAEDHRVAFNPHPVGVQLREHRGRSRSRRQHRRVVQHHNVCSEFEYLGSSGGSNYSVSVDRGRGKQRKEPVEEDRDTENSVILYMDNCDCEKVPAREKRRKINRKSRRRHSNRQ